MPSQVFETLGYLEERPSEMEPRKEVKDAA
jgi:hypothetical protein